MLEQYSVEGEVLHNLSVMLTIELAVSEISLVIASQNSLQIFNFKIVGLLLEKLSDFLEVTLHYKGLSYNLTRQWPDVFKLCFDLGTLLVGFYDIEEGVI